MKKWLLALAFIVTIPAHSEFMTGNDLYELYKSSLRAEQSSATDKDFRDANEYLGYVTGVWDAMEGTVACTDDKITRGQIADMVGGYLRSNPSFRDKPASSIIMLYMSYRYPCKK